MGADIVERLEREAASRVSCDVRQTPEIFRFRHDDGVRELLREAAAEIGRLRGEVEALRQCGVKYLGWLGVKDAEKALRKDMADPEMVARPAPAMLNGVEYDRELIARMLTELSSMGSSIFLGESISAQAELLIAADNRDAAGVCSCPSGDGSLRWPCKAHPPEPIAPAEAKDPAPAMPNVVEGLVKVWRDSDSIDRHCCADDLEHALRAADNRDAAGVSDDDFVHPEYIRGFNDGAKTTPAAVPAGEAVAWRHPDEVPEVVPGGNAYFWVAVRRKHDGRVYSFPAQYLNAMLLCNEWSDDTERSGNRYHHGPTCEVEGSFPATGWHDAKEHGEYDCVYQPLLGDADELVAWREVANYPDTTPPAPVQAAPQEGEAVGEVVAARAEVITTALAWGRNLVEGGADGGKASAFDDAVERLERAVLASSPSACELGADTARLDWLEANCVDVADEYGTGSQLYFGTYATAPLRTAIDRALQPRGDSQEVGRG